MSGIVQGLIASLKSGAAAVTDAYFNLVTLLLNTTTTNGAQNNTFLDSSSNNFTITRNGNTTQGTFTPFSQTGWGNYFDGNGDGFTISNSAEFDFGSGDFTIELWASFETHSHTHHLVSKRTSSGATNTNWTLEVVSGVANFYASNGSTFFINLLGGGVVSSIGVWYHIAVTRSGNDFKMFINGTQAGSTLTSSSSISSTSRNLNIGLDPLNSSNRINGYVSNLRIVKGTAVYTAAFTPPTAPLTAITNTSLLTCQSNRFIDNSTNAFALTPNGNPSVQAFSPFAPTAAYDTTTVGGSGYFDGTGDYLTIADNAAFDIGASEFSIEAFVYPNASVNSDYIFGQVTYSTAAGSYVLWINSTGYPTFYSTTGGTSATRNDITSSTLLPLNSWSHICICRSGTTLSLFLNGARVATQTYSSTIFNSANTLAIGADAVGNGPFNGYISNLRMLKGTSAYDATQTTLTVPTAPVTAITNTQLLCNYTNAGIYDAAAKNVLETVGNAQVSTTQAKFGTTSMSFDGTGDWLISPASAFQNLGTSDFTIDGWFYFTTTGSVQNLLGTWSASPSRGWFFYFDPTLKMAFTYSTTGSNAVDAGFGYTPTTNTWVYLALVRSGADLKFYANGTQQGSTHNISTSSIYANTQPLYVGERGSAAGTAFNGYMDELRITRYARTVTTTPTAAFPIQ